MNLMISLVTTETTSHQHNEYEIMVCTKGKGTFCGEEDIPVSQGSMIIVPPRMIHKCAFEDALDRICIRGDFSPYFALTSPVVVRDNIRHECSMLANMIYHNRYANPEYVAVLMDAFVHCLMRSIQTESRIHAAVTHIIDQITGGFFDYALNLQELLEASGYAEDYIRAQFKKITGKTPNAFLTNIRIRHACCLIDAYGSAIPLTEIAAKCGYTDYVYFSKKFKAVVGVSPRTYIADTFAHSKNE